MVKWNGRVENMERLRILITGATGFVGSNLTRFFQLNGHDVGITIRDESNPWRISDIEKELSVFRIDITDSRKVRGVFSSYKPDIVINTAAFGGYHFEKNLQKIYNVNLNGTMNLVEAFLQTNSMLFVNTGSSSEYGFKDKPMKENDPIDPYGHYAVSKAAAALYCRSRSLETNRKLVTLRLFSVYGYYEELHRLIPYIITSMLKETRAKMNNPDSVRDFIFIEDIYSAYNEIIKGMDNINNGEILNLGTGKEYSVKEIVKIAENISKQQLDIDWQFNSERTSDRARHWVADISKLSNVLHWVPKYTLESGLSRTYDWFKENISKYEVMGNAKITKYSK